MPSAANSNPSSINTARAERFLTFVKNFADARTPKAVDGDYYDLPGTTVYHTYTHPLAAKGRLEANIVTPAASADFEWTVEITLNDKASGQFVHLIVRPDNSVVETYGKTVLPVSSDRAAAILRLLKAATR